MGTGAHKAKLTKN